MAYKNIKSKYITGCIRKTGWKKRQYIDDLVRIEKLVLGKEGFGWLTGYIMRDLEERYPNEWKAIHIELDPKGYGCQLDKEKEETAKEKAELQRGDQEEKEIQKSQLKEWLAAGGLR